MLALAPLLLQAAPFLANLFFSDKTGAVVQKAADIAGAILGADPNSPEAMKAALAKADPAKMLELQTALAKFAHDETMQRLKNEDAQRQRESDEILKRIDDVADARQRDVRLRETGHANSRANWMIAGDVLGLVLCLGALAYLATSGVKVPEVVWATLGGLVTHFGLCLRDAHNFEFGSSAGSREKTTLLAAAGAIDPATAIAQVKK